MPSVPGDPAADPDLGRRVEIHDYDPHWPIQFEKRAGEIAAVFGAAALSIEHVGSTSVPGLAAKPVIDIHLTVRDSADEATYRGPLEKLGYRLVVCEPEWFEHRMFKGAAPETNLHVFSEGCPELERCRIFRDWLRAHAADRELYAATKRSLSRASYAHVQDYADAKTAVVQEIMARALAAARSASGSA